MLALDKNVIVVQGNLTIDSGLVCLENITSDCTEYSKYLIPVLCLFSPRRLYRRRDLLQEGIEHHKLLVNMSQSRAAKVVRLEMGQVGPRACFGDFGT